MTFPSNNLPTASRNWGREVEKKVTNLESSFRSAEVNNVTRDSQLSVTANTALSVANLAQQAADDAAAAASQASSAASAASGAAALAQSAADTANSVAGIANDAASQAQGAANAAQAAIDGLGSLDEATSTYKINAANITVGSISADRISGGNIIGVNNITAGDVIFATGNLGAGGNIGVNGSAFITGDITTGGAGSTGAITRSFLSGGGTTGASFTNSGALVRTTSSQRYKTDVEPLQLNLVDLYEVEPKTFKRIEEVEEDPETARVYPGFIAEELAGTSLDKFVFYSNDEDGNSRPEGIHYPELTAALLLAIKDLNARLQALESR